MLDLLLVNGNVVDGSGAAPFLSDVAVQDGKIVRIAPGIVAEAHKTIDLGGEYLTPGFIDIHRHSDAFVFRPGFGEVQIRQGITSTVNGNCGLSIAPCPTHHRAEILQYLKPITGTLPDGVVFESFSEYLSAVEKTSLPLNFGMHVGNGTLRMAAKGFAAGKLTPEEVRTVHRYLEDALAHGAFGLSMGVVYMPETLYDRAGFLEALEPLRGRGIPLVTHIRGEGNLLLRSLEEVLDLAEELDVPLHISHFKCVGKSNWGTLLQRAIRTLDEARARGVRVTCDVYPWTAGSTQLVQLLPPAFLEGGLARTTERLRDPEERARCRAILEQPQTEFENLLDLVGWENIMLTALYRPENQPYIGKRVTEIAAMRGQDPYDAAFDLLAAENCDISMVNFIVCEEDIETILKLPYSLLISDSIYPDGGKPHPRQYGTFPKLLTDYVRDKSVLTLEEAVRKMTGAPAELLRIPGKGLLREGYDADLTAFDLRKLQNHADYLHPSEYATGISYVFVNGELTNDHDHFLSTSAGKVLRRKASE